MKIFRFLFILSFCGALAGGAGIATLFYIYGTDSALPRIEKVSDYHPKVVTKILDRDGELIGEIYDERRTVVPRAKIPDVMIHAIVDAEDAQFYEHKGLNYVGLLRALLNDLRPGAHLQGGSTITQQLVKTYLLHSSERTLKRKMQDMILAHRLEQSLTKDDILYLYLNQIEFGHQRFGVEEAAQFYFGRSISDVNAGEAALLASLPKGPTEIDPWKHAERAKDRQRYVLSQMVRYGHLDRAEAEKFATGPIQLVRPATTVGVAPEIVDEVRRLLSEKFGADKLGALGLIVRTSCDSRVEKLAREALEHGLESLDERQGYRKPVARIKNISAASVKNALVERSIRHLSSLVEKPSRAQREKWLDDRSHALAGGKVTEAVVVELRAATKDRVAGVVLDGGGDRAFLPILSGEGKHDRYNPSRIPPERRFAVGDILPVRVEPSLPTIDDLPVAVQELGPQAAAVVIDPATREIRALVGGYNFHAGSFDRALHARRQPGSAFKPFLYATAFASGKFTAATILNDAPQVFELDELREWRPKNAESHEFLGPVRLRVALAKSLNTVAAQLVHELGPEPLAQTAHNAGIESKLDPVLALGLGASVVTLLELTNSYATFAANGKRAPATLISQIGEDAQPKVAPQEAFPPELAYLVTSMLESVIDEGTAASAKGKLNRPAAGKTGTTSAERDAWFVGYTPDLVAGVWVGFDDLRDLGHGEQGARSALPIWTDIINGALKNTPPRPFAQPPGIVVQRIDPKTGLLVAPGAPNGIDEKFLAGTAPTNVAPTGVEQNPDTFIIDQQ